MMPPLDDYADLMPVIDEWEKGQAEFLGKLLYDTLKPAWVIDWGCASGLYLLPFKERGSRVVGVDAEPTAGQLLSADEYVAFDIRKPAPPKWRYDLALCIETAEHLQPEYADQLVSNVAQSADTVFWSAAGVGQGGTHHYNMQPQAYWLEKFVAKGFGMHPSHSDILYAIAKNPECQKVCWLLTNAMLLGRTL